MPKEPDPEQEVLPLPSSKKGVKASQIFWTASYSELETKKEHLPLLPSGQRYLAATLWMSRYLRFFRKIVYF